MTAPLLIMGGAEDRGTDDEILRCFVALAGGAEAAPGRRRRRDAPRPCAAQDRISQSSAPGENRTPDALLRTEALCPLSYGGRHGQRSAAGR